jgi:hypothetical protein
MALDNCRMIHRQCFAASDRSHEARSILPRGFHVVWKRLALYSIDRVPEYPINSKVTRPKVIKTKLPYPAFQEDGGSMSWFSRLVLRLYSVIALAQLMTASAAKCVLFWTAAETS